MDPKVVQDIKPPAGKEEFTQPSELIKTETGQSIPVKAQGQKNQPSSPAAPTGAKQFVEEDNKTDSELEDVLKDVNKNIKKTGDKSSRPFFLKKIFQKRQKLNKAKEPKQAKPVLAIIAALVVAAGLSVLAFHAYSQDQNAASDNIQKTGTSNKAALNSTGQNQMKPSDVSDLSLTMSSKLDGFNDAQDFNTNDLSDKSLGL
jgi:hypothetical protein